MKTCERRREKESVKEWRERGGGGRGGRRGKEEKEREQVCVRETTAMGCLRLVGALKFQVSFAEYTLFYRALLQKRPIILRSLLIVATPYTKLGC